MPKNLRDNGMWDLIKPHHLGTWALSARLTYVSAGRFWQHEGIRVYRLQVSWVGLGFRASSKGPNPLRERSTIVFYHALGSSHALRSQVSTAFLIRLASFQFGCREPQHSYQCHCSKASVLMPAKKFHGSLSAVSWMSQSFHSLFDLTLDYPEP